VLSTVANAVFGLVYWVAAARLFDAEEVGKGAAAVSALMLVSMLGFTGVQFSMIRFIPVSGANTARLALGAYAAALGTSLVCAAVLLVVARLLIEPLRFLADDPLKAAGFLAAVIPWVVFSLEDSILIGLRRTNWVPLENAIFAVVKIGLLVALSSLGGAWALFVSWSLASALMVVPVNLALFFKFIPGHVKSAGDQREEFGTGDVVRFSLGNHAGGIVSSLPDSLMPIIVLNIAGGAANAYFYTARTVIFSLRLIAMNIANAFTAEASARGDDARLFRWALLLAAALLLPVIVILLVEGELVLRIFGREYAENGALLMRFLVLGLIPFALANLYAGLARVRRQLTPILFMAAASTAINLTLGVVLVSAIGIEGAGIAWLAAQSGGAAVALLIPSGRILQRDREPTPESFPSRT
jgi:O-antigen/teichoic acid export membrane protein